MLSLSVIARNLSTTFLFFDIFMSTTVFFRAEKKKKSSMFSVNRKGRFLLFVADLHGYNNERTEV